MVSEPRLRLLEMLVGERRGVQDGMQRVNPAQMNPAQMNSDLAYCEAIRELILALNPYPTTPILATKRDAVPLDIISTSAEGQMTQRPTEQNACLAGFVISNPPTGTTKRKFKGVTKSNKKWRAKIGDSGQTLSLGSFGTEKLAAVAYDKAAYCREQRRTNTDPTATFLKTLNFPGTDYSHTSKEFDRQLKDKASITGTKKGVTKVNNKWRARLYDGKQMKHVGIFDTEEEAFVAAQQAREKQRVTV